MHWPHGDPNQVAKAVLAQSAYRRVVSVDTKPVRSIWAVAWDWIVEHILTPLFRPIGEALSASQGIGKWVGVLLIGFALVALAFLIFRLAIAFVRPRKEARDSADGARALQEEHDWREWLALARAAAQRGDYASAIVALFAASLAVLDERAVFAFDPARTPGEYRRLVRRERAEASPPFDVLAERFVRAAYAPEPPARADFEAAERAFASFEPLVAP